MRLRKALRDAFSAPERRQRESCLRKHNICRYDPSGDRQVAPKEPFVTNAIVSSLPARRRLRSCER
jgi:hypothetical protein